jgi:hypothetical protein
MPESSYIDEDATTYNVVIPSVVKKVEKTEFLGTPYEALVALLYLDSKFSDYEFAIPSKYSKKHNVGLMKPKLHEEISIRWVEALSELLIPKNFFTVYSECLKKTKQFVVCPFGFSCTTMGHANYLIYDKLNKSMERFEPHGDITLIFDKLPFLKTCILSNIDDKIREEFSTQYGDDFIETYYKPCDFMPRQSFQSLQESLGDMIATDPGGFCASWAVWYVDLRLSNPDIKPYNLVRQTIADLNEKCESLTSFIRNYSSFISDFADFFENNKKYNKDQIEELIVSYLENI